MSVLVERADVIAPPASRIVIFGHDAVAAELAHVHALLIEPTQSGLRLPDLGRRIGMDPRRGEDPQTRCPSVNTWLHDNALTSSQCINNTGHQGQCDDGHGRRWTRATEHLRVDAEGASDA